TGHSRRKADCSRRQRPTAFLTAETCAIYRKYRKNSVKAYARPRDGPMGGTPYPATAGDVGTAAPGRPRRGRGEDSLPAHRREVEPAADEAAGPLGEPVGDAPQLGRGGRVGVGEHERLARVAALAQPGVERHLAEQRHLRAEDAGE